MSVQVLRSLDRWNVISKRRALFFTFRESPRGIRVSEVYDRPRVEREHKEGKENLSIPDWCTILGISESLLTLTTIGPSSTGSFPSSDYFVHSYLWVLTGESLLLLLTKCESPPKYILPRNLFRNFLYDVNMSSR